MASYAKEWVIEIEDISAFVGQQRTFVEQGNENNLTTPRESVFTVRDERIAARVGLDEY